MKRYRKYLFVIVYIIVAVAYICCGCTVDKNNSEKTEIKNNNESNIKNGNIQYSEGEYMELSYAKLFTVFKLANGCSLITINNDTKYLLVPETVEVPTSGFEDCIVLKQPITDIYMASTSTMDLFRAIDGLDSVSLTSLKKDDWSIDEVKMLMNEGSISFAGKYSAPDFELIIDSDCKLAIENTMIFHTPEIKEQLEALGIPVFVDMTSYEEHPLGRLEWIKLYGLLLGKEAMANEYFEIQAERAFLDADKKNDSSKAKTVAFFYVNQNGSVNVRKSYDYVSKMIELAGGKYIFENLGDKSSAMSTVNMQLEEFYMTAKDADILIYNSTITGELDKKEALLEKSELFSDFKAYKEGNVYCTDKNMFQQPTGIGDMILDLRRIISGEEVDDNIYIYKLY